MTYILGGLQGYDMQSRLLSSLLIILGMVLGGCGKDEVVTPKVHDVYLRPEKIDNFLLNVYLINPPPSHEPLDVLFLFDATMSMANIIDEVRSRAGEIMNSVREVSTNSAFGVASFADYTKGDNPWRLHQDLTLDITAVNQALNNITMENGGDLPEAYSRALYESQFLGWRDDASKFIILFGDAPAHDPDFYGKYLGIDPGRDGIPNTADDLRLKGVVSQLARKKIAIIAVYDTARGPVNKAMLGDATQGFKFMARETDGLTKPVKSAKEIPQVIKAGLRGKYHPKPGVVVPPDYHSWVTISDPHKADKTGHHYTFDISLQPSSGTPSGIYIFPLTAVHPGGGEIGKSTVIVRIGIWNYPWRWILIPAYLSFLTALALLAFIIRQTARRYMWNRQGWALLWRLLVVGLLLYGLYLIWVYAPGTVTVPV